VDFQDSSGIRSTPTNKLQTWGLSEAFIAQLLGRHTPVEYEKDSVLFVNGSPADIFFFVVEGVVHLYVSQPDGKKSTFMFIGPGEFLGFANSKGRNGKVHNLDASALTRCSVSLLTRRHLVQLLAGLGTPTLRRLIEDMNTAWSKALLWQVTLFRLPFRERFTLLLHELGVKFGKPTRNGVLVSLKLGHADFAEMIGCSRPIMGKILAGMRSAGVIEFADRGEILLREALFAAVREISGD
jgi:CRP-like cAMP-binding protein